MKRLALFFYFQLFLLTSLVSGWNGTYYHKNSQPQQKGALCILSQCYLTGDECILDAGCGTGAISKKMAERVPRGTVVGLDGSADMVSFAQKAYKKIPNLCFNQCKIEQMDYTNKFDMVCCFSLMHWVKEQQKALHNISQSLKPSGKLIVMMAVKEDKHPFKQSLLRTASKPKWQKIMALNPDNIVFYPQDLQTMKSMVEKAGLNIIEATQLEGCLQLSRKELINWLNGWLVGTPQFAKLKKRKQRRFLNELIDDYVKFVPKNKGVISYPYAKLKIIAEKI